MAYLSFGRSRRAEDEVQAFSLRRRTLLAAIPALAHALLVGPRLLRAQPEGGPRGAVCIGIDRSTTLPALNAAASGALQFAQWLRGEGFEVKELVDVERKVSAADVFNAIEEFVSRETLEQLVVFFSGHGFNVGYSEQWLLSDAPYNPNESISLRESVDLARHTAIPNVVFISDACRSTTESLGVNQSRGSLVFPTAAGAPDAEVEVDQFFAALPGDYALEVAVASSTAAYQGIYTRAFLKAFTHPSQEMVRTVGGLDVVPNRSLKGFLRREVQRDAEAVSIQLKQLPDSRVESGETTYLGRVRAQPAPPPPTSPTPTPSGPGAGPAPGAAPLTILEVAGMDLERAGVPVASEAPSAGPPPPPPPPRAVAELAAESGYAATRDVLTRAARPSARAPRQFETRNGLVVHGARVERIATSDPRMPVDLLERGDGDGQPAVVRCGGVPCTLLVELAGGTGTIVANLPDFIATVVVSDGRAIAVSYLPSANGSRWQGEAQLERVNAKRAAVAAASQHGVFRVGGDRDQRSRQARGLADSIRVDKGIDPTLGLYAAYAYTDVGLVNDAVSVREFMIGDLGVDVFDVAMLANRLTGREWDRSTFSNVVPLCPMLNQGWGYLRVRGVLLPGEIEDLRQHLVPSLWSTLDAEGVRAARDFLSVRLGGRVV